MTLAEMFGGGIALVYIAFVIFGIVATIVGIIAAFGAAWWMGLLCFIPPLGFINGVIYIGTWGAVNAAAKVAAWLIGAKAAAMLLAPSVA